ncbi:MAG: hypothetical protein LC802_03500 [Acidobacteria bacterium]|nr:hypothetical protein [Acidobacteriota bacterium]
MRRRGLGAPFSGSVFLQPELIPEAARSGGLSNILCFEVEYWNEPGSPDARDLRRRMEREGYNVVEWADRTGAT